MLGEQHATEAARVVKHLQGGVGHAHRAAAKALAVGVELREELQALPGGGGRGFRPRGGRCAGGGVNGVGAEAAELPAAEDVALQGSRLRGQRLPALQHCAMQQLVGRTVVPAQRSRARSSWLVGWLVGWLACEAALPGRARGCTKRCWQKRSRLLVVHKGQALCEHVGLMLPCCLMRAISSASCDAVCWCGQQVVRTPCHLLRRPPHLQLAHPEAATSLAGAERRSSTSLSNGQGAGADPAGFLLKGQAGWRREGVLVLAHWAQCW